MPDSPFTAEGFVPHPLLRSRHLMTVLPRLWPRPGLLAGIPIIGRRFSVSPDTQILGMCSWQPNPDSHRTLIVVHGLEGGHDSPYMEALAAKGWRAGLNVIRLNQRTCGGTEDLTPTLYHSGLSGDLRAVIIELAEKDGLSAMWVSGFSMGGQLALKMAGEVEASIPALRGVLAVCPNLDPPSVIVALERSVNRFYQAHFLKKLRERMQRKARLYPGRRSRILKAFARSTISTPLRNLGFRAPKTTTRASAPPMFSIGFRCPRLFSPRKTIRLFPFTASRPRQSATIQPSGWWRRDTAATAGSFNGRMGRKIATGRRIGSSTRY